ncbi:hypothetical protein [Skermanella stibiiresistens]|nr:hypothetical protein [Skermanella stibiiresistens]
MSTIQAFVQAASDHRIQSVVTIHTMALLAAHADSDGYALRDNSGQSLGDPRHIAAETGYGVSTIYKALTTLETLGYIAPEEPTPEQIACGVIGRIRIQTPAASTRA